MKLTIQNIKPIPLDSERDIYAWDDEVAGFGIRIKPSGIRSFILQYRNENGVSRRITLGKMGVLTPEEARKLAKKKLAEVANGDDPAAKRNEARQAITVAELCDLYLKDVKTSLGARGRIKKESTLTLDKGRIEKHIKKLIGTRPVVSLTLRDIEKLQNDIAVGKTATERPEKGRTGIVTGGRATASRTIGLFSTILEFARSRSIIKENPARGVKKFADEKRKRFLSLEEIAALGEAMRVAGKENRTGIAAVAALLLTGCRKTEILSLPWSWFDEKARCIRFEDTKTGAQLRPIGVAAVRHIASQPERVDEKKKKIPWIFPADRGNGHFVGLPRVFERLCEQAKLEDATLHTLRHTFASTAAELGFSELTIAGLLGHTAPGVTARYAHVPDRALLIAADTVSARIEAALSGKIESAEVIPMIATPLQELTSVRT